MSWHSERLDRRKLQDKGFTFVKQFLEKAPEDSRTVYENLQRVCQCHAQVTPQNPALANYTDHSYTHVQTVLGIAGTLLETWQLWDFSKRSSPLDKLSEQDVLVLFACCNLHDILMSLAIRTGHDELPIPILEKDYHLSKDFAERVSRISRMHSSNGTDLMLANLEVTDGLLGALLRFADCLDCTEGRVGGSPKHFRNFVIPTGQVEENVWQMQLSAISIRQDAVIVHGRQKYTYPLTLGKRKTSTGSWEEAKTTTRLVEKVRDCLGVKEFNPCQKVFQSNGLKVYFEVDVETDISLEDPTSIFCTPPNLYAVANTPTELLAILDASNTPNAYMDLGATPTWAGLEPILVPQLYQESLSVLSSSQRVVLRGAPSAGKTVLAVRSLLKVFSDCPGIRVALIRRDTCALALRSIEVLRAELQAKDPKANVLFVVDSPDEASLACLPKALKTDCRWLVTMRSLDDRLPWEPEMTKVLALQPEASIHREALRQIAANAGVPEGGIDACLEAAGYLPGAIMLGRAEFHGALCALSDKALFWVCLISQSRLEGGPQKVVTLIPQGLVLAIGDLLEWASDRTVIRVRRPVVETLESPSSPLKQKLRGFQDWRQGVLKDWEAAASQPGPVAADSAEALLAVGEYSRYVRACARSGLTLRDPTTGLLLQDWWGQFLAEAGLSVAAHPYDRTARFPAILAGALRGNYTLLFGEMGDMQDMAVSWAVDLLRLQARQATYEFEKAVAVADSLLATLAVADKGASALYQHVRLERLNALLGTDTWQKGALRSELQNMCTSKKLPRWLMGLAKLYMARYQFRSEDNVDEACRLVRSCETDFAEEPRLFDEMYLWIYAADFYAHAYRFVEARRCLERFRAYVDFLDNKDLLPWYYGIEGDALRRERLLDAACKAYENDLSCMKEAGNEKYRPHVLVKLVETLIDHSDSHGVGDLQRVEDLKIAGHHLQEVASLVPADERRFFFWKAVLRLELRVPSAEWDLAREALERTKTCDVSGWGDYEYGYAARLHAQLANRSGEGALASQHLNEAIYRFQHWPPELAATYLLRALFELRAGHVDEGGKYATQAAKIIAEMAKGIGADPGSEYLLNLPVLHPIEGLDPARLITICEATFAALEY